MFTTEVTNETTYNTDGQFSMTRQLPSKVLTMKLLLLKNCKIVQNDY